jgi:hypothetical protein
MMHPSLLTIVRFTVEEGTLHALLSGNPERRRALRDIEWGSRDTQTSYVLVTPPLRAEEAVALRALFADAEGVKEVDVTGEYAFAYTTAPEVYDGHGTLSFTVSPGAQEGERLVAIRHEHLTWQASRYASGLHLFRPVEPDPPPEAAGGAPAEPAGSLSANAPPSVIGVGTVLHFLERTRRYVVVRVEVIGEETRVSMVALSGAVRGSYPTAVPVADIERDSDQTVAFTGAAATTLHRKYDEAMRGTTQAALPMAS